jgi:hypothetical protein
MAGPDKSRVIIFNSDGMGRTDTPELPQVLAPGSWLCLSMLA